MAASKDNRRTSSSTTTIEAILRKSHVSQDQKKAWKAALKHAEEQPAAVRFPAYEQLYLLNLYAQKMVAVLRETKAIPEKQSAYYQAQIQEIRSAASQDMLESIDGVEMTDSLLFSTMRQQYERQQDSE